MLLKGRCVVLSMVNKIRKDVILYEYETFKANEGEQLLDTYLRYLQMINDLRKCGYKKDNCELNYKFLNNLQPEWKQYGIILMSSALTSFNIFSTSSIFNKSVNLFGWLINDEEQNDRLEINCLLIDCKNMMVVVVDDGGGGVWLVLELMIRCYWVGFIRWADLFD
nr:hypothetical protein [Tanacetum cinerariifolium]